MNQEQKEKKRRGDSSSTKTDLGEYMSSKSIVVVFRFLFQQTHFVRAHKREKEMKGSF